jgi:hypothetical protein
MLQAGHVLLAFQHAIDFLKLGQEIGATEFDLLARPSGAKGICVKSHKVVR